MTIIDTERLCATTQIEYPDIVVDAWVPGLNTLRILMRDGSFVDVWYSLKLTGRYSYHWERRSLDGTLYRHDNAPHQRWKTVSSWPKHFHDGSEDVVTESHLPDEPEAALREVLDFVRANLAPNV